MPPISSPTSTIESLTREFEHALDKVPKSQSQIDDSDRIHELQKIKSNSIRSGHSLDITQLSNGSFVVKPQDHAKSKAEGPISDEDEVLKSEIENPTTSNKSTRGSWTWSLGPHR